MNKTTIVIISSFLILVILLVIILIVLKQRKKKHIFNSIDRLTTEKNMIISPILIMELNKAEKLVNNKKIEKDLEKWKKEFDSISSKDMDDIANMIVEVENSYCEKEYDKCRELIYKIEKSIYHSKAKANKLLNDIRDLTESEERNREAVTKLKSLYRETVFKYNKNKDEYKEVSNSIDLQLENIDKLFSAFEVAIVNNEYEELGKIVKVLDDMIHNISVVIDEAPTIILICNIMLPKKMHDIKSMSAKLIRDGYNLEYLNIDYNIEETNKKINEIMDRLKVLNLEDSIFDLKTLMDYYESLYNDFDSEKRSKKNYERGIINITDRINKVSNVIRNLYAEIEDIKDTYDLTTEEIKVIDEVNMDLIKVKDNFKLINDRSLIKVFPYTKLCSECELVAVNLSKVEDKLELTLKNLGSLKEDESRARDQLLDIKNIIRDSKYKIKDYNLPLIPKTFYIELKEANDAVNEIINELEKKPISIKTLNLRVDTARDLALKVYQTTITTTKTAAMAEMAIVYGNRYRSTYKNIDIGIINATKIFNKGDYKGSLEMVLNVLNTVEPGIHKRLLKDFEG